MSKKNINIFRRNKINIECEKLFKISSDICLNTWENHLEISTILNNIIMLEDTIVERKDRIEDVGQFIAWLKEGGADFSGISIAKFPGYDIGLRADLEFDENELILKVPRKLIFNVHTAALELKDLESDMLIKHMPQVALAIALLIEKNKHNSKWKPYLNILPKEYFTILYMNSHDMKNLKGSPTLEPALKQCRNIARQYSYFYKLFQNTESSVSNLLRDTFTYEEYRWAVSTVMSRQNLIPSINNMQMVHSLIPMWDMCNHEEGKITTEFNILSDSCECYAMRKFQAGDQIFIYYGPRSNNEFFVHSGFVYANNKNDSFVLRLGISKADLLRKQRIELLARFGLAEVNDFLLKPSLNPISGTLLTFLRIFTMDKTELDHWMKSTTIPDISANGIFEKYDDTNVLNFIITRIKLLLSSCDITKPENTENLSGNIQRSKNLIIEMRLLEKKILEKILAILQNLPRV